MSKKKPLMRNIGEFFGHIARAVKSNPSKQEVKRTVEEEEKDDVILRRTTIEEIEFKDKRDNQDNRDTNDSDKPESET